VDGLVAGNPVYVNGFSVGQVKDLELAPDNRVKVLLQVASDVSLSDSTVAKLMNGSLLGGKSIVLIQKKGNKILVDGDSIASFAEPGMADVLMNKAEPIMQNFDKTLTSANKILDEENQKKIAQLLVNLEAITKNTNELVMANKASIAATTSNLSTLTNSLIETEKQFKPILSNLNSFSDSLKDARLKATVAQANKTMADLDETITKINKGNGSIGKLINEDSLYVHLDKTIKDLDKVFLDMKERPSRYIHFSVFGKKDK